METSGATLRLIVVRQGYLAGDTTLTPHRLCGSTQSAGQVFESIEPHVERNVAERIIQQIEGSPGIILRAIDIVPTAQQSLASTDRSWNERN
ncbi:hypothetical protein CBOM_01717 [Ceraceosorus bombacis]|uniref:Uncharacterized protein n=1 Tax=Ceraceosorus bombacis TaxID=401625 RepID=A0A0P1BCJ6_9BASI|nr:hypothetical protein CBOM_01717 [Ceraceosorus bombacis]